MHHISSKNPSAFDVIDVIDVIGCGVLCLRECQKRAINSVKWMSDVTISVVTPLIDRFEIITLWW